MSANITTGKTRTVRYCGADYVVAPGDTHGKKQAWIVLCDGQQIRSFVLTKSKAAAAIHEHAVECGKYPSSASDGVNYTNLVSRICRS